MKTGIARGQPHGWTLVELMVVSGAVAFTGLLIYSLLIGALKLFGRNVAVNVSHQAARYAVDRITRDVHSAISIPMLIDTNLKPVTTLTWSPGISCIVPSGPPLRINADAAAGQNVVQVATNGFTPAVGQRLIVPTHLIEADIAAVTVAGGNTYNLTLAANLPVAVTVKQSGPDLNVVAQVGTVIAYVVQYPNPNRPFGELWYYPDVNNAATHNVIARDITSAAPFAYPTY